ncbi:transketolase [Ruminococcaceae bacterium OttesenSCG-928-I18]|nr:transketolase [Ruminococcaceae bacterium OttesenSCG-928-I18]
MTQQQATELQTFAARIRLETVKEVGIRGFGHIGGALSIVDLLAVLYGAVMRIDPKNPGWLQRDKLVVSKGHAGPSVYATLGLKGYFPMDWLKTLNQPGTHLPSHCDMKLTPGIDMTTGSLGQGTSAAIGLALAQRMDGNGARTYLITGDGELDEGQCWEAAMFAPHHDLPNLTWFVDYNRKQLDGDTDNILPQLDIGAKFEAFGWHVQTIDGNDVIEIHEAIDAAHREEEKPSCIVMNTKKGAGIPCIEEIDLNHHIVLEGDILEKALECTKSVLQKLEGGQTV